MSARAEQQCDDDEGAHGLLAFPVPGFAALTTAHETATSQRTDTMPAPPGRVLWPLAFFRLFHVLDQARYIGIIRLLLEDKIVVRDRARCFVRCIRRSRGQKFFLITCRQHRFGLLKDLPAPCCFAGRRGDMGRNVDNRPRRARVFLAARWAHDPLAREIIEARFARMAQAFGAACRFWILGSRDGDLAMLAVDCRNLGPTP